MSTDDRGTRLDRARRRLDTAAPTVPGQLATDNTEAEPQPAPVQLPIFAVAGGAYWKAWRTT